MLQTYYTMIHIHAPQLRSSSCPALGPSFSIFNPYTAPRHAGSPACSVANGVTRNFVVEIVCSLPANSKLTLMWALKEEQA